MWETSVGNRKMRSKKTMLQELRAFVLASTQNSFLTDLYIEKWTDATVLDLLGDDLGARVLEHVAEYQATMASEANISNSTGSTDGDALGQTADKPPHEKDQDKTPPLLDDYNIPKKATTSPPQGQQLLSQSDEEDDTFRKESFRDEAEDLQQCEQARVASYLKLAQQGGCLKKILVDALKQSRTVQHPLTVAMREPADDNVSMLGDQSTSQSLANRLKLSSRSRQVEAKASLLGKWKAPGLLAVAQHGEQGIPIGKSLCDTLDRAVSVCVE